MSPVPLQGSVTRGLLLMAIAMIFVPGMDATAKVLGQRLPALEVAFARMAGQMVLAGLVATAIGATATLWPRPIGVHLLRGYCLAGATLLFFMAIATMPLADAISIFFVQPMILTGLSAVVLKEKVGWRRWSACAVGFAGALVIVRPGWSVFGLQAALPLGSAGLFACYLLITRRLSGQGSLLAAQFVTGLGGALLLGSVLAVTTVLGIEGAVATMPTGPDWLLIGAIAMISLVSHGLVVKAFALAPATVLAPLNYLEIVSATTLGYLVFGDFPDGPTWIGIALIVGSGFYIVHRERVTAKARSA